MVLHALPIWTARLGSVEAHIVAQTMARVRIVINVVPPVIACCAPRIAFSTLAGVLHVTTAKLVLQGPSALLRVLEAMANIALSMPTARLGCAEKKSANQKLSSMMEVPAV